jgi:hypothetical protein
MSKNEVPDGANMPIEPPSPAGLIGAPEEPFGTKTGVALRDPRLDEPEDAAERFAFMLWSEGRKDEAVEFLERQLRHRRKHAPGAVRAADDSRIQTIDVAPDVSVKGKRLLPPALLKEPRRFRTLPIVAGIALVALAGAAVALVGNWSDDRKLAATEEPQKPLLLSEREDPILVDSVTESPTATGSIGSEADARSTDEGYVGDGETPPDESGDLAALPLTPPGDVPLEAASPPFEDFSTDNVLDIPPPPDLDADLEEGGAALSEEAAGPDVGTPPTDDSVLVDDETPPVEMELATTEETAPRSGLAALAHSADAESIPNEIDEDVSAVETSLLTTRAPRPRPDIVPEILHSPAEDATEAVPASEAPAPLRYATRAAPLAPARQGPIGLPPPDQRPEPRYAPYGGPPIGPYTPGPAVGSRDQFGGPPAFLGNGPYGNGTVAVYPPSAPPGVGGPYQVLGPVVSQGGREFIIIRRAPPRRY